MSTADDDRIALDLLDAHLKDVWRAACELHRGNRAVVPEVPRELGGAAADGAATELLRWGYGEPGSSRASTSTASTCSKNWASSPCPATRSGSSGPSARTDTGSPAQPVQHPRTSLLSRLLRITSLTR